MNMNTRHLIFCRGDLTSDDALAIQELMLAGHSFADLYALNGKDVKYTDVELKLTHDSRDYKAFNVRFTMRGGFTRPYLFLPTPVGDTDEAVEKACRNLLKEDETFEIVDLTMREAIVNLFPEPILSSRVRPAGNESPDAAELARICAENNLASVSRFSKSICGTANNTPIDKIRRTTLEVNFGIDMEDAVDVCAIRTAENVEVLDSMGRDSSLKSLDHIVVTFRNDEDYHHEIWRVGVGKVFHGKFNSQYHMATILNAVGLTPVW